MLSRVAFTTALSHVLRLAAAVSVSVDSDCNRYVGTATPGGVTQWLGLRYAAPPLGDLRFEPPQDPSCIGAELSANAHGPWCLGTGDDPAYNATSEDCLFLDVYAPTKATRNSKLPVYFFIQGGGFNTNANPNLNGRGLIRASDDSIVVVTINYRVGPWGFIVNGDKIVPNIGLLDQRKALEWVQKYITYFGGDPDHVVLGGASAGAASVSLHLMAYGGRDDGLFHAAAAESVSFATVLTADESQYQYDNLAIQLGCAGRDSLACIKSKSAVEIQTVNRNIPYPGAAAPPLYMWGPVIDYDFIPDYPYNSFARGEFIKVPLIVGDDTNEGTVFTPRDTSTLGQSDSFLKNQFPFLTLDQLGEINALYPNRNHTCPNAGCWWRQVSDAYGDLRYVCPGLFISSAYADTGKVSAYTYRYNVEDPEQIAQGVGVPHTVELNAIFGPGNTGPVGSAPASYYPNGTNAAVVPIIQAYWTSFIRTFDPNTYKLRRSATWDAWNPAAQDRLLFDTGGGTRMEFTTKTLREQCDYFYTIGVDIRQRQWSSVLRA